MARDTDGTNWITVRYTVDIEVMAETNKEALYFANLKLPDYSLENYYAEIVDPSEDLASLGSCDTCGDKYELSSREGRCGDCGDCGDCCGHKEVG